jgi:hypothetical protein
LWNAILRQLEVRGGEVGDELAVFQDSDVNFDELPA